jgi:hypothetical protein
MKLSVSHGAALLAAFVSINAQANIVYTGADDHGRLCRVEFSSLQAGPVVMHDACEFETDGPGPWCEGKPPVAIRTVVGSGTFSTLIGYAQFTVNDKWASFSGSSIAVTGDSSEGYVGLNFVGPNKISVHHDFLTPYGKTLTPAQRNSVLINLAPGTSYAAVYASIYSSVTCNAQL